MDFFLPKPKPKPNPNPNHYRLWSQNRDSPRANAFARIAWARAFITVHDARGAL